MPDLRLTDQTYVVATAEGLNEFDDDNNPASGSSEGRDEYILS